MSLSSAISLVTKTASCLITDNPVTCMVGEAVQALAPSTLYGTSKACVTGTALMAYACGKGVLGGVNAIANKGLSLLGFSGMDEVQNGVRTVAHIIGSQVAKQDAKLTATLLQTTEMTAEDAKLAMVEGKTPFKVSHLIGPVLFMGYCGNKCVSNLQGAAKNVHRILSGKLSEDTLHNVNGARFKSRETFTKTGLAWTTFLDLTSAAASGALAYFTAEGVRDVLVEGGLESSQANMTTAAIATLSMAPTLIKLISMAPGAFKSLYHSVIGSQPKESEGSFMRLTTINGMAAIVTVNAAAAA